MSNQAQAVTSTAKDQTKADQVTMNIDDVENFASESVTAFVTYDRTVAKAGVTKLETVKDACAYLPAKLTAADYDRLVSKGVKASLALAVKRGKLEEGTAFKVASQLKKVALAIANGIKPEDGMGFIPFYNAAVIALEAPSYGYVYGLEPGAKRAGAPVGTTSKRKGTGRAAASAPAPKVEVQTAGAAKDPMLAAALILTKGQETRAQKLVVVMQSFVSEFDKWTATIIPNETPKA